MQPFKRLPSPGFLTENWEKWGEEYAAQKMSNQNVRFSWDKPGHRRMNLQIRPILQEQTDKHCSYCDFYPARLGDDTIDHFKPKGRQEFFRIAYQWENMYFSCWHCQKAKGEQYDEALLRPDEPSYSFERYFIFKFATGEIQPNPNASEADRYRAQVTIRLLGMNEEGQLHVRKREWRAFDPYDSLNDRAFRFIFE